MVFRQTFGAAIFAGFPHLKNAGQPRAGDYNSFPANILIYVCPPGALSRAAWAPQSAAGT